jgi:hypothetical protein
MAVPRPGQDRTAAAAAPSSSAAAAHSPAGSSAPHSRHAELSGRCPLDVRSHRQPPRAGSARSRGGATDRTPPRTRRVALPCCSRPTASATSSTSSTSSTSGTSSSTTSTNPCRSSSATSSYHPRRQLQCVTIAITITGSCERLTSVRTRKSENVNIRQRRPLERACRRHLLILQFIEGPLLVWADTPH